MEKETKKSHEKPFGPVAKKLDKLADYFIYHRRAVVRWPGAAVVAFISLLFAIRKKVLERY